ncbi:putative GTPase protein [Candidatus Kuenenia stuttgartiensis]|uniref:Hypothetical GTPase protein n=1 Tax=Kuenenia stuttgartiensis TaxID=174633 RepID=Q1Q369_KUEST|nr:GTPase [Candidatus Kuenenia stuttgartiensis]QII11565.1 putative GTPase protein [Candidatus Kuenenia stuttgartiensis]CAJ74459.1 hypothetical GTPase protein [Candidatus Kuenenia stuttgartiensis]
MIWFLPVIFWALFGGGIGAGIGAIIDAIINKPRQIKPKYRNTIIVSFYGPTNAGKSSGVKALFGIDTGLIHPIPGSTKEVSVWTLPDGLSIADTPGLQDINDAHVVKAKRFIDNTDIFIYVINSNGGITEKVQADLELLKAIGRPLLVVLNKIDTIEKSKREEFVKHQSKVAAVDKNSFLSVAFDPLPQISRKPINVELVQEWISKTLKEKGELLLKKKGNSKII